MRHSPDPLGFLHGCAWASEDPRPADRAGLGFREGWPRPGDADHARAGSPGRQAWKDACGHQAGEGNRRRARTTTPWPNPPTARTRPGWYGGVKRSATWPIWNWRRSGGSRGGTRSSCTGHWATGYRKRWKPSIMQIKRCKPSHYEGGTKIRPYHWFSIQKNELDMSDLAWR